MKYEKHRGTHAKGFYLALGLSLLAVGVAAWTTYDSVVNFTDGGTSSSEAARQTEKTVSGVKETPSSSPVLTAESEEPASSAAEEPVSSAPEKITVTAPSEPEPEPAAEPAQETAAPPADEPETPQSLSYPIGKSVSVRFSGNDPVYSETMGDWRVHSGADLPGQPGETVAAACDGTVSSVTDDALYGGTVVVTQGTLELHYCGVDEIAVEAGQTVSAGDALGVLGEVPCESADGSHLHFGVRQDGAWIDPMSLLN